MDDWLQENEADENTDRFERERDYRVMKLKFEEAGYRLATTLSYFGGAEENGPQGAFNISYTGSKNEAFAIGREKGALFASSILSSVGSK